MVIDQIKNIDTSWDNRIDSQELENAIQDWFFNSPENLQAVWNLLNWNNLNWWDLELLNSLEQSLNNLKDSITSKDTVNDNDRHILWIYNNLLWSKHFSIVKEVVNSITINRASETVLSNYQLLLQNEKDYILNFFFKNDKNTIESDSNFGTKILEKIENYINDSNFELSNENEIKTVNVINKLLKGEDNNESIKNVHDGLVQKVNHCCFDMIYEVNRIIAQNSNYKEPRKNYTAHDTMLVQLRANVCYWEDLEIDWLRWGPYSLDWWNKTLTSIYFYRLEIRTRQDVIDYRHNNPGLWNTDHLLNIPKLDEILSVLPREDQNDVLEMFLTNCFLRIRQNWMHFEDLIWSEYFENLLTLSVKVKTEWNISIEQWIRDRQNLINSLETPRNESLIKNIQEEINVLSTKNPATWEYVYRTMWEYYQAQVDELTNTINTQNKNNIDIEQRQKASYEAESILTWFALLLEQGKLNDLNKYKEILYSIIDEIATMYNDTSTTKYRKWIESWELINQYVIKYLAVQFNKCLSPNEQHGWWEDFFNFMNKCRNEISNDINCCSDTLDIVSQIESIEVGWKYELEPTYWKPWEFLSKTQIDFFSTSAWIGLMPPNMPYPLDPDIYNTPTSYKLQLWMTRFEWWPWVKDVFNQVQSGELNVVITQQWYPWNWIEAWAPMDPSKFETRRLMSAGFREVPAVYKQWFPWELCKYEDRDWEIWLRKFNPDGTLPSEPTKIITWQDIVQSNLAMSSAIESLDTENFNDVMKEFSKEKWSFMEIQESIEWFMRLYNKQELSHDDVGSLRRSIRTMLEKIDSNDIDTNKLRKLRESLVKMQWNWNGIQNPYEESIQWRISQIDTLIKIKEDPMYRQNLLKLTNLESNDDWYEQVDWVEIIGIIWSIAAIVAWIILAIPSWWTSLYWAATVTAWLSTFLTWVAAGALIKTTTYLAQQQIITNRNYRQASAKQVTDWNWNIIWYIPWYIEEQDMSTFYKYWSWKISLGEHLWNVANELWPKILDGVIQAMTWYMVWGCLWQISNELKMWYQYYRKCKSYYKIFTNLLTVGVATEVIFIKWTAQDVKETDIIKDIDNYFDALIPTNLRSEKHEQEMTDIFWEITCQSMDTNGNLIMEYNPDCKTFKMLLNFYTDAGGVVREDDNWVIVVEHHGKTVTYRPSKVPAEYRWLSSYEKETLERVWCVRVNHNTWKITYKHPEWLGQLRLLSAYMENSWEWDVFISDNWLVKVMFKQWNWNNAIVTIQPENS